MLLIDSSIDFIIREEIIDKVIKFDPRNPFEFLIEKDLEGICIDLLLEMFSNNNKIIFYPEEFFSALGILV